MSLIFPFTVTIRLTVRDFYEVIVDEAEGRIKDVAALVRSHMNVLQPFESTIEQITEPVPQNNNRCCDVDK